MFFVVHGQPQKADVPILSHRLVDTHNTGVRKPTGNRQM